MSIPAMHHSRRHWALSGLRIVTSTQAYDLIDEGRRALYQRLADTGLGVVLWVHENVVAADVAMEDLGVVD